ncbi:MAG: DUF1840 domain-containing protein [Rubrivivax sp.]|jgi:hypothetical protein|nr:DUF1840 domain-containing protein [Rubrivivax sp.]MBK7263346.1 DUF1840 domain-containing protein [Rubrivivax sp.]MBK8528841.1 DUF1840 domain-containing protein [Rubrivivax sp.]
MIYKFKCKATGDLIMLGPQGDQLLRLLGREPAAQGILEPAAMAAARQQLERGLADAEAAAAPQDGSTTDGDERRPEAVGLRQRVWPFVQMLDKALAAGEPIVWGV